MSAFSRPRLLPNEHALGWTPYAWLIFLPVLFVPPAVRPTPAIEWALLVAGAALFVASYFRAHWVSGRELRAHVALQSVLGAVFSPIDPGAYVLFTYAASAGARAERAREAVWWIVGVTATGIGVAYATHAPLYYWIGHGVFTPLIGGVSLHRAQTDRANERLRAANDEIARLAAIAERERIARDLHDVLGHTLSLIVLKSELASRLAERDPARAVREIRDVEDVSRRALTEVREAIRGYRARLADEIVHARHLLETSGISVTVDCSISSAGLDGHESAEEALALALREAVTNVARHSGARHATIRAWRDAVSDAFRFEVVDDGVGDRGSAARDGNGLRGMRERIGPLNGVLTIDATHTGTRLAVALPAHASTLMSAPLRVVRA
jgi:two-component system, NarL family, sensor histidine kinase DesK